MEVSEAPLVRRDGRSDRPAGEPSVASSLEDLVSGSQGMVTKHIDLALLEGQELLSRLIERAALVGASMILAAGAWFAGAQALVLFLAPDASPVFRLAAFGVLDGLGAVGVLALAMRHRRLSARVSPSGNQQPLQREPLQAEGEN